MRPLWKQRWVCAPSTIASLGLIEKREQLRRPAVKELGAQLHHPPIRFAGKRLRQHAAARCGCGLPE